MKTSTRVFVNTIIQYVRTILSVLITLYTSRIVLENLGVDDFGIYSLVGGVVSMLSFIRNSLSSTTQRYLSYNYGKDDKQLVIKVFNNSVVTQTIISIFLCGLLLILTNPIFNHFLNIPSERLLAAKIVYFLMLVSLFFNLQSTPYLATLIARENILYSTIIQIVDALLKIPIAISLYYISQDKLVWYALCCCLLIVFNYVCYYIYCKKHYDECQHFTFNTFDFSLCKEMFSFMGWMVYSTGCIVGRTQGIAIIINKFFSTAVNAAYGIGLQVSGQMSFLSNALVTAIRPQIIKAEGAGNRERAIRIAEMACKFSSVLMGVIVIPSVLHMDKILALWLVNTPQFAVMFCQYALVASCIDQLTLGLAIVNSAIGNIRAYSLCVNTVKLLTVPAALIVLCNGFSINSVMIVYVIFESFCVLSRLMFLKVNINFSIKQYIYNVFLPLIFPFIVTITSCVYIKDVLMGNWFLLNYIVSCLCMFSLFLFLGLKYDEKQIIIRLLNNITKVK